MQLDLFDSADMVTFANVNNPDRGEPLFPDRICSKECVFFGEIQGGFWGLCHCPSYLIHSASLGHRCDSTAYPERFAEFRSKQRETLISKGQESEVFS